MAFRCNRVQILLIFVVVGTLYYFHSGSTHEHTGGGPYGPPEAAPKHTFESHFLRKDGLFEVNMAGRHPIRELIEGAERTWRQMHERQSKTLKQAVDEYIRRNGYGPPAGFDLWWNFVQKHGVKLVDEFDQINYDITPFLAMPQVTLRQRIEELDDPTVSCHFNITNGNLGVYGPQWWHGDERGLGSLILAFSRALPNLTAHVHRWSRGEGWISENLRREAAKKVQAGEYFTVDELERLESREQNAHRDLKNVCADDDIVFNMTSPKTAFVQSQLNLLSPCKSPSIYRATPLLFMYDAQSLTLIPNFVFSKFRPGSGFLLPFSFIHHTDPLLTTPHPWKDRSHPDSQKLFWRGNSGGANWFRYQGRPERNLTWRDGAKASLSLRFGSAVSPEEETEVLMENDGPEGGLVKRKYKRSVLNEKWMDVGMIGTAMACSQEDGTCDEMNQEPIWKEPYLFHRMYRKKFWVDLDDIEPSPMFQKKLNWGAVVLKSTAFAEWNTQWLIPYYHYIPVQPDYSDVYNIMAFFMGDPERGQSNNEALAEEISKHASDFARTHWRWQDMQAYMYRLLLEYARLISDDREAATFHF
ncbi:hypothetical protein BU17DRAFT_92221 [Hysterangium stoloniferum]|nr:hypothetical protein BU17DRAFT_92221 [Hysterangium stoloniferum]